jgi:hypothetical protein
VTAADSTAYERFLDVLADRVVRANGSKASARCPAHDDTNPSLAITGIEGQVLVHCHAGCDTTDVLAAVELTMADLYDTRRGADYRYDNGRVVHRRLDKSFPQSNTENPPELHRLSKVRAEVAAGRTVYVAEGEKDVHALEAVGVTATCAPMGAAKWSKLDPSPLYGATRVVIIADRDKAGAQHASDVLVSLKDHVVQIQVVQARRGKDAADHIAADLGPDDFVPVEVTPHNGRRLYLTPASSIKPRPVRWLWEGRIALGSLGLLGGREGAGKSTAAYDRAAHVTRGTLAGHFYGSPKAVIVAATEDSWEYTIVPRLMAAGADLDRVHRVNVETADGIAVGLSLPRDIHDLEARIAEADVALVLLDPLMSRLDAALDSHKDAEVRLALEPIVAVAYRTGAAVLCLIHVNKGTSVDPLTLLMASRAFPAVARSVLFVMTDPDVDGRRLLGQPKNNLGPTDTLPTLTFTIEEVTVAETDEGLVKTGRLVWGQDSERNIHEALALANDAEGVRTATSEAADWLRDYLTDNGGLADSADVKREGHKAGHSNDALKRARQKLKLTVQSKGFPRRTTWEIPGTQLEQLSGESISTALTAPTGEIRGLQSVQSVQSGASPGALLRLEPASSLRPASSETKDEPSSPNGYVDRFTCPGGCGTPTRPDRNGNPTYCANC